MFASLARAVFGTSNDRALKGFRRRVAAIAAFEPALSALTDEELRGKTVEFRERLAKARPWTACWKKPSPWSARVPGGPRLRHFDVQMIGGMVLHAGKIAEMKTGEGKTWSPPWPYTSTRYRAWACMWSP